VRTARTAAFDFLWRALLDRKDGNTCLFNAALKASRKLGEAFCFPLVKEFEAVESKRLIDYEAL
jgi:hypothetical protein